MPIIQPATHKAVRQGDILKGITLHASTDLGVACKLPGRDYCVVVSRDCVIEHSKTVLVAAIRQFKPEDLKKVFEGGFERARRVFCGIRSGDGTPDHLYVGSLPDENKRFAIALKEIFTIKPRQDLVSSRVACLSPEYIRHLQVRIFQSIGMQGFDDNAWWATDDLRIMVSIGKKEVVGLEAEIVQLETAGGAKEKRKLPRLRQTHDEIQTAVNGLEEEMMTRTDEGLQPHPATEPTSSAPDKPDPAQSDSPSSESSPSAR